MRHLAPWIALGTFCMLTSPTTGSAQIASSLVVEVETLRSDRGTVRCVAFASADGFPSDPTRARESVEATPHEGRATCVFALPPGTYAIAIHHDEDGEGDFDTGLFGIRRKAWAHRWMRAER